MILRIRFDKGHPVQRRKGKNRTVALAFAALLKPMALLAYVLGVWRLASDVGAAGEFGFTGILSHWQLWIGLGGLLTLTSYVLNRYAFVGRLEVPEVLSVLPLRGPRKS